MKTKLKIKKGDYVQVVSGENKDKKGKVLRVLAEKNKIVIEGVNYICRHMRKTQKNTQGGRIEKEAPIDISNVKLYCHHCQSVTSACYRYEQETETEDKSKQPEKEQAKPKKVRCCTCPKHMKI